MNKLKISKNIALVVVTLLTVFSTFGAEKIFVRVTLKKSIPEKMPVFTSVLMYRKVFEFEKKIAFGKENKIISFTTGFHDIIDWRKMKDITPLQPGEASNWIDISDWIYTKIPKFSGWFAKRDEYSMKVLVFGFYSPKNDKRADKRPIHKNLEMGNLDSVTAKIDFSTSADKKNIFKTVSYTSDNSAVPVFIKPDYKGVKSWGKNIMSLYAKGQQRLKELKKLGVKKQPLPKHIYTSIRVRNGYFYSVFDKKTLGKEAEIASLMGVKSIMWWGNKYFPKGFDHTAIPKHRPFYEEGGFAKWVNPNPWVKDFDKFAKTYFERQKRFAGMKYSSDDPVMRKFGDEWKLFKTSDIKKYPEGLKAFREWLTAKQINPQEIGFESLEEAMPIEFKHKWQNKEEKYLFYLTSLFRQDATIKWWKKFMLSADKNAYTNLIKTSETCWEGVRTFADIFKVSEANLFDVATHEYAQSLWVPSYAGIYKATVLRSAARYAKTLPGILYCSQRGGTGMFKAIEMDGTTAVINGMRHFYWYNYGPYIMRSGGDQSAKDVAVRMAKIMHRFATLENLLINGKSPLRKPETAVLKSYSSELWNTVKNNPSLVEFRMAAAALAWNQLPYDILSEEWLMKYLKNYKLLYIVTPNLPKKVQQHVAEWVQNGGILFLVGKAADYNESNELDSLSSKFAGAKFKTVQSSPVEFISLTYGKGTVIKTNIMLGDRLKKTFSPAEKDVRQHAVFHKFNDSICKSYLLPFALNKQLKRPLIINKPGVDATFYESPDLKKAVVIMADYESDKLEKVDLSIAFEGVYNTCKDEKGRKYQLKISKGRTIIKKVPLKISNVLFISKE
jgi:hypothetical protein